MNQPVPQQRAPSYPSLSSGKRFEDVRDNVRKIAEYTRQLSGPYLSGLLSQVVNQVNNQVQGVGDPLPSAATIIPTNAIHHVTGTAAISNINAPSQFSGPIFLIADGLWSMTTGGNIARAVTPSVNSLVIVTYDYRSRLWYPDVGAGSGSPGVHRSGRVSATVGVQTVAIAFSSALAMPYSPQVSLVSTVLTSVIVVSGSETVNGFTAKLGVTPAGGDTIVVTYAAFAI